jgi:hypothetical protein
MNGRISYLPSAGNTAGSIVIDGITIIGSGSLASPYSSPYQVGDGATILGSGTLADPFVSVGDGAVADGTTISGVGTIASPLTVISHSNLPNLSSDTHLQYLNINGRVGGQTAYGGTLTTQTVTIQNNIVDKLGFIINADGSISANTTSYENLITSDNDIPNKKYVDAEAAHSNLNLLESFSDINNNLYYSGALVNYHSNIATLNFLSMYSGDLYFSGSPISVDTSASSVSFSNIESGLIATNTQAAIDEIVKNMYILM